MYRRLDASLALVLVVIWIINLAAIHNWDSQLREQLCQEWSEWLQEKILAFLSVFVGARLVVQVLIYILQTRSAYRG